MPVVVVANPKGGVGKSTLATNIAGYYAAQGHAVMLGDADRQQSSALWLQLRPPAARPIRSWELGEDQVARPPRGTTHAVIDTPGSLQGWRFDDVMKLADKLVVPLQASVFDIFATRDFLDRVQSHRQGRRLAIGIVGMRMDSRTLAADKWRQYVGGLGLPVLGELRNTQNYVHLAARGLTLFDLVPQRVAKDLEQWQALCRWLDAP